jgi:uncharacterized cupredoxin-like copper-binding protein
MTLLRLTAALALALAAPAASQPAMPAYTIALDSFSFTPHPIVLAADRPIRIVFTNRSGSGHDFTARRFFKSSRILHGSVPEGEIERPGHATASVDLIPARGRYEVHCSHFGHKMLGMSTEIIVN